MENNNINKLVITEWLTLAGLIIACFLFNHAQMQDISNKLDQRINIQCQRTDDLYKMFIDLIKEGKK